MDTTAKADKQSMSDGDEKKDPLEGIGGWLIVMLVGLLGSPVRILMNQALLHSIIADESFFAALTTPGTEYYHPLWGTLLYGEVAINFIILFVSFYMIYLFFRKKKIFPRVYIWQYFIVLGLMLVDAALSLQVMPEEPFVDTGLVATLISGMIWIPYMLKSKRVKATFVE